MFNYFDEDQLREGTVDAQVEEMANADILITESMIIECMAPDQIAEAMTGGIFDKMVKDGILNEKSIVKLDKVAKRDRATMQAVYIIASEKGDRDFKKLLTVQKMRKALKNRLIKKYWTQAQQRTRKAGQAAKGKGYDFKAVAAVKK